MKNLTRQEGGSDMEGGGCSKADLSGFLLKLDDAKAKNLCLLMVVL